MVGLEDQEAHFELSSANSVIPTAILPYLRGHVSLKLGFLWLPQILEFHVMLRIVQFYLRGKNISKMHQGYLEAESYYFLVFIST